MCEKKVYSLLTISISICYTLSMNKKRCGKILGSSVNGYYSKCGQLWMGRLVYCDKCNKYNKGLENDEYSMERKNNE